MTFADLSLIQFITQDTPITAVTLVVFFDGALKAFIPLLIGTKIMAKINRSGRENNEKLYDKLESMH